MKKKEKLTFEEVTYILADIMLMILALCAFVITVILFFTVKSTAKADADIEHFEQMQEQREVYIAMMETRESERLAMFLEKEEAVPLADSVVKTKNKYLIDVTAADIDLMARVVMSECSTHLKDDLGTDVAQAIATTIVNRVRNGHWGDTVQEVVYYPNAYSTADNGTPTPECYSAVYAALTYEAFDKEMFYFREGDYHEFGREYTQIGNTYFSCR